MRKHFSSMMAILVVLALVLAACANGTGESPAATDPPATDEPTDEATEEPTEAPSIDFTACQVSDTGGIDDRSFNQNAWEGMQRAEQELGIEAKFLESSTEEDYSRNIQQFIDEGCDLIITVGFLLGDATAEFAEANPDVRFAIVDFAYDPALPNVEGLVYDTAPAAMLAGYAAASWSRSGIMGTFGGINIGAPVTDFMDGFIAGANYWNEEQGASVRVLGGRDPNDPTSGSFTGNFSSTDDARNLTIGFLQEGADVILPVGGPIGLGTFAAIEEQAAEAVGLGVDVDWYFSAPEYSELILTSIMKRIDNSVFAAIERAVNGEDPQPVFVSTLENEGVGIAPFHDYEGDIDQSVVDGIEALRQALIAGDVTPQDYYGD
ncbi:MAG TPA: BMP family ABC transporter substrate-binding protein [Candidatus Limnocylindrales bacterium]|nr:BMP family ABC transporter substrate-binding protein [Candidatus Limnocylindrales bacterium]